MRKVPLRSRKDRTPFILLPHLKDLSADERRLLPKMADKTVAFVSKTHAYMSEAPELVPPYVNLEEQKIDLEAVESLKQLFVPLQKLTDLLDDTMLLSGSEAYVASLAYYNYVKGAVKAGVPGTDLIYQDLKKRFPSTSK